MRFEKFKKVVYNTVRTSIERNEYLNSIPVDMYQFIVSNDVNESLFNENSYLLKTILGKELHEELDWFLYEWKEGNTITLKNGTEYIINNISDFVNYITETYNFDD